MPAAFPAASVFVRMTEIASLTGASGSSVGAWPSERPRSAGPIYTPSMPSTRRIASKFSIASTVSIIANAMMKPLASRA
jgi:hypothetical protein